MTPGIGTRLASYDITGVIGTGGMGEVYRARDTRLNRDVAIKILPDLFAADPEGLKRFEREAQTPAALNHPNIAQIYGIVDVPTVAQGARPVRDGAALVMEFIDGEDLAQRIPPSAQQRQRSAASRRLPRGADAVADQRAWGHTDRWCFDQRVAAIRREHPAAERRPAE